MARHPMYTSMFIYFIGFFLLSGQLLIFSTMLLNIFCAAARIRIEERLMINEFGQQYIDYMRNRGAFCPFTFCDCGINPDKQGLLLSDDNEQQNNHQRH